VIDPRLDIIRHRLSPVKRILAVSSVKGGVGKSVCAALCALALKEQGFRTGLLDLDFQGASAHLLLGAEPRFPEEAAGIKPLPVRGGLQLMSFALFSRERPVPLRGEEVSQAMLELLAITIWGPLDFLLCDLPPGIGEELLDLLRYLDRVEFLIVATPSRLALTVVERLLVLLSGLGAPLAGVVENMAGRASGEGFPVPAETDGSVKRLAHRYGGRFLGSLPFEPRLDALLAGPDPLQGPLGEAVRQVAGELQR
jgi:ATP-binding protein involved in chromosome partitioning